MPTLTEKKPLKRAETSSGAGQGWRTILFNCDCHTFDEVERQLMKAIHCPLSKARQISWEVHTKGSAVVYQGTREHCEAVAGILSDIKLLVQVHQ